VLSAQVFPIQSNGPDNAAQMARQRARSLVENAQPQSCDAAGNSSPFHNGTGIAFSTDAPFRITVVVSGSLDSRDMNRPGLCVTKPHLGDENTSDNIVIQMAWWRTSRQ
jgi:hypothetical protein